MGHASPASPASTEPREPIPVPTDADRAAAFPPIAHGAMEHAPEINSLLLIDRLEHWDGKDSTGQGLGGHRLGRWQHQPPVAAHRRRTQQRPHRVIGG